MDLIVALQLKPSAVSSLGRRIAPKLQQVWELHDCGRNRGSLQAKDGYPGVCLKFVRLWAGIAKIPVRQYDGRLGWCVSFLASLFRLCTNHELPFAMQRGGSAFESPPGVTSGYRPCLRSRIHMSTCFLHASNE